ncbi:glycosyltransferase family protein [Cellulophaga tyrosinoxydans]|uniref:Glycosyl transferase family 2 n=1 Tax=Cellulophaga tyrosinoxydans TaxID=504486 RepID=A0A1W2A2I9_9FLAO|nr:glycosyltransferase [Cellulophaga tyrosinoxydans]SMC54860.1 Glycosyl transferase family 2 [Cellulophaga tyrosinoxydans]
MNVNNTPIVIVAYNRPRSLKRLLSSIEKAHFIATNIDLIISIDKAPNNQEVLAIANDFEWKFGTKKVQYQKENLGLRAHILQCGALSETYGSVIVLEDDLYVAPNFYEYATQALNFSLDKECIGGISLYTHQLNVHTKANFHALEDGYDNWYFQFASSWGQAWTKAQWNGFMKWYEKSPILNNNKELPDYVKLWSEKSWLKYNISYLVEKNLFFLYPKVSLTTNFSDAGTHVGKDSTIYQVPLDYSAPKTYKFSIISKSLAVYDVFFESKLIAKKLGVDESTICIDLFGYRKNANKKYLLSSKILDFHIVKSFGKSLKPIEANIFEEIVGYELFLYDTEIKERNIYRDDVKRRLRYNKIHIKHEDALYLVKSELKRKIVKAFSIIFKR